MFTETLTIAAPVAKGAYIAGVCEGMMTELRKLGVKDLNFEYTIDQVVRQGMLSSKVVGYKINAKFVGRDKAKVAKLANIIASAC